ncbi:hypothetical protein AGOR_G00195520 [Albula goreensis]|uniref:Ankyrin-2-like n=1 Tax=Albula goreensis TaxID=1534307 RepID=A0A8T3CW96_9TELE|nr:hypothetical protein AGOR_G00195520 [Albula goreensis]
MATPTFSSPEETSPTDQNRIRQSDSNTSFLRAARAGNLEKVLECLKGGVDINTCNQNGLNALHLAAKEGHLELVEELLERAAPVDSATKKGNTALHIASLAGQEGVARLLVKRGRQCQRSVSEWLHSTVHGCTGKSPGCGTIPAGEWRQPEHCHRGALQQGHNQVVSLLLEKDTKGKVRLPALHIAARKDDTKAAALLLQNDHNADVQSKMMVNRTTENGKSGFTPLHIAAHYGNVNVSTLLLNRGAAVNFTARNGITPLHVASKRGNSSMVRLLLDRGAQIDAKTRDGLTPLHCAARSGHDQTVELLLERGAPLLARTKNGLSPLHMSAQGDHVECMKHLLHHSAPVDDVTLDYLTSLHVAAHCGHYRVTKLLLDKRANPNARALNGFTPLHIACKKNRVKVMELLLKYGAIIQAITESGLTPIHVAAFMGHTNIILLLLQNGASPDIRNIVTGETALHMAARAGQTEAVRCLLRNGALVDATAREDQTPLHIASRLGKAEIVQLLLQHMAHPDASTLSGYTPLHISAREGQLGVASVLMEAGANNSLPTKKGFTPLHVAAKYGSLDVAKLLLQHKASPDASGKEVALLLLDHGASPHAAVKNGYTPLHIAAKRNQLGVAEVLLRGGAGAGVLTRQGVAPLHLAAQEGHCDMAALLLCQGAHPDTPTKTGLTALHMAAQEDRVAIAEILREHEADLDPCTKMGYTPLIVACHYGNVKMVNFLLQHGANVDATTKSGYTPLHQAAQQGNTHIINVLLQHGARPNTLTVNGNTALDIARRLGYISVVDTLKVVTEEVITKTTTVTEKHKLNVPETMTEMLDVSDEEGEDTMTGEGGEYLRPEDLQDLGDDSLPGQYLEGMNYMHISLDAVRSDSLRSFGSDRSQPPLRHHGYLSKDIKLMEGSQEMAMLSVESCGRSWGTEHPDNITSSPFHSGRSSPYLDQDNSSFLVSFMVDARGGAMRGCRHNGLRIIIPPRKCSAPTRVTCRLVKRHRVATMPPLVEGDGSASRLIELGPAGAQFLGKLHLPTAPPPLNEAESLVSRILQLGPPGTLFLGPVVVEIPHFAALRGAERELVILRSETGESWREHHCEHSEEDLNQILNGMDEELDPPEELERKRICRIITRDFPQFFAVVSRVRQDSRLIGPEGGVLSSSVVPLVQARFPEGALTKRIRVGLQAQPIEMDLVRRILGNRATFGPIVTLEPRRRKFHKPITMTIPVPKTSANEAMASGYRGDTPTLRLLCSITGGTTPAQWEDITGSTPLTFTNDCVSFTTNVSARFWLLDCLQVQDSVAISSQVYREVICVPYMAKFVIFAKTLDSIEARLHCFCMTDDKMDKTLEQQENFAEVARSRDVEVLEGKPIYADCFGNLVPLTKSGQQHIFSFFAFKENRLALFIKVRDSTQEPCGRLSFMKEPKVYRSPAHKAICNLNITLPPYSKDYDSDLEADQQMERTHEQYNEDVKSADISALKMQSAPQFVASSNPDLLSDVSEMKRDLIRMTAILATNPGRDPCPTADLAAPQGGLKDEPLEIVGRVKEDLEKVGKILRSGTCIGVETDRESGSPAPELEEEGWILLSHAETGEAKKTAPVFHIQEPLLQEIRIDRGTSRPEQSRDMSGMVTHLSGELQEYLQQLPDPPAPLTDHVQERFEEIIVSRGKPACNSWGIKKPARRKMRERRGTDDPPSMGSESDCHRFSSEESLQGENGLGSPASQSPLPGSPGVEETPIGSIKDRVKALQQKVEEEEKEMRQKPSQVSIDNRSSCIAEQAWKTKSPLPQTPRSPRSQTERLEETMSVHELMKAFQTGKDPSKCKSGLFEHKALITTTISETHHSSEAHSIQETQSIQPSPRCSQRKNETLDSDQRQDTTLVAGCPVGPQISPDRRHSEDFSAVIKAELEENAEYQLFRGAIHAEELDCNLTSSPAEGQAVISVDSGSNCLKHSADTGLSSVSLGHPTSRMRSKESYENEDLAQTLLPTFDKETKPMPAKQTETATESTLVCGRGLPLDGQLAQPETSVKVTESSDCYGSTTLHLLIRHQDSHGPQPSAEDLSTGSQHDSLEGSPVMEDSSHRSPDSIEPSPTKESPCCDSLENSPVEQAPKPNFSTVTEHPFLPAAQLLPTKTDFPLEPVGAKLIRDPECSAADEDSYEQTSQMESSGKTPLSPDTPSSEEVSYEVTPKTPDLQALPGYRRPDVIPEDAEEEEQSSDPQRQFTPEEEMFKMAAKIKTFDEMEQDAKSRKDCRIDLQSADDSAVHLDGGDNGSQFLRAPPSGSSCLDCDTEEHTENKPEIPGNLEEDHRAMSDSKMQTMLMAADSVPGPVPWSHIQRAEDIFDVDQQSQSPSRTPTEEVSGGDQNPFLFQEGKLFEMTRSGAIDVTMRSIEDEEEGFAFYQIREGIAEEPREDPTGCETSEADTGQQVWASPKAQLEHPEDEGSPMEPILSSPSTTLTMVQTDSLYTARHHWDNSVETMKKIPHGATQAKCEADSEDDVDIKEQRLSIIADHLGFSWAELAQELEFSRDCIQQIRNHNPNSLQDQSHALLKLWIEREGEHATESSLVKALAKINRVDIAHLMEMKMDQSWTYGDRERTASLDQSDGFSVLQEEMDSSPKLVHHVTPHRPPPAASEEDLSMASLHEITPQNYLTGHTRGEELQTNLQREKEMPEEMGQAQSFCQEVHTEPREQVSPHLPERNPPMKMESLVHDPLYKVTVLSQVPQRTIQNQSPATSAEPTPKPILTSASQVDLVFEPGSEESSLNRLVIIRDFGSILSESDTAECDFDGLWLELRETAQDYAFGSSASLSEGEEVELPDDCATALPNTNPPTPDSASLVCSNKEEKSSQKNKITFT